MCTFEKGTRHNNIRWYFIDKNIVRDKSNTGSCDAVSVYTCSGKSRTFSKQFAASIARQQHFQICRDKFHGSLVRLNVAKQDLAIFPISFNTLYSRFFLSPMRRTINFTRKKYTRNKRASCMVKVIYCCIVIIMDRLIVESGCSFAHFGASYFRSGDLFYCTEMFTARNVSREKERETSLCATLQILM